MPPRWFCFLVVLAWVGTTGPLLWREVRPLFLSNQPPEYTFDLLDQAQGEQHRIRWIVFTGDQEPEKSTFSHTAESWVRYHPRDDTYTLHTELKASRVQIEPLKPLAFGPIQLLEMSSEERITRSDLQLVAFQTTILFNISLFGLEIKQAKLTGSATVSGGKIRGMLEGALPGIEGLTFPIPETDTPSNGAVQLPLHLINRIRNLTPGQTWQVPMIDPVKTLLNYRDGGTRVEVKTSVATVLPEPQPIPNHPDLLCHVIEYDTETKPRVYVQVGTGLVLRQEAKYQGTRIVIQRFILYPDR